MSAATSGTIVAALILLVGLVSVLIAIAARIERHLRGLSLEVFRRDFRETMAGLGQSVQQYVLINQVQALMKGFEDDPTLLDRLEGYSVQLVGANLEAWEDSLGRQLAVVRNRMEEIRRGQTTSGSSGYWQKEAERVSAIGEELNTQLVNVQQVIARFVAANRGGCGTSRCKAL